MPPREIDRWAGDSSFALIAPRKELSVGQVIVPPIGAVTAAAGGSGIQVEAATYGANAGASPGNTTTFVAPPAMDSEAAFFPSTRRRWGIPRTGK